MTKSLLHFVRSIACTLLTLRRIVATCGSLLLPLENDAIMIHIEIPKHYNQLQELQFADSIFENFNGTASVLLSINPEGCERIIKEMELILRSNRSNDKSFETVLAFIDATVQGLYNLTVDIVSGTHSLQLRDRENGRIYSSVKFSAAISFSFTPSKLVPVYSPYLTNLHAEFVELNGPDNLKINSEGERFVTVAEIEIGRGTHPSPDILQNLKLKVYDQFAWKVHIGSFCSIAENVMLMLSLSTSHRYDRLSTYPFRLFTSGKQNHGDMITRSRVVQIGNDVWIGENVMIVNSVTIGDGAVIGANAVVRADVPPYAIVIGNPAQVVKYRFSPAVVNKLLRIRWWDWPDNDIVQVMYAMNGLDDLELFLAQYDDDGRLLFASAVSAIDSCDVDTCKSPF